MNKVVSICMPTYNHQNYIAQAIESVMSQVTSFSIELIIGEDCSSDDTRNICIHYKNLYTEKIQLLLHKNNLGGGGRNNFLSIYNKAKGKYLVILEGDDYWTDPYKLQKQVDFLEANPDFSICFHNAKIIDEGNEHIIKYSNAENQKEISGFEDLVKGEYIYTATCMFRMKDFKNFPEKYYKHLNNYTVDLHNAQYGKIKYINELMSVYRVHAGGVWSMVAREKTLINQLPVYEFYIHYFDKKYRHYFKEHVRRMLKELLSIKLKNNDYADYWKYYIKFATVNFYNPEEIKWMLKLFLKSIYNQLRR